MRATLAQPPTARLLRTPRSWIVAGAWCALGVTFAAVARARGAPHGADRALLGAYGALVLPFLAYSLTGAALGTRSLSASIAPLVAFGAAPGRAAAASLGVAMAACTVSGALLALLVALVAHGSADPPLVRDAFASAYAGALGGAAYAGWFVLGSNLGKRGGGRTVFLVLDWVLDQAGGLAVVTPRAHLRNLLGGAAPLDFSGHASAAALVVIAASCALAALVPPVRSFRC